MWWEGFATEMQSGRGEGAMRTHFLRLEGVLPPKPQLQVGQA